MKRSVLISLLFVYNLHLCLANDNVGVNLSQQEMNVLMVQRDAVKELIKVAPAIDNDDKGDFKPHKPTLVTDTKNHTKTYHNERFGFKFVYPDYLLNGLEATNCDGCSFFNKDKTLNITAVGSNYMVEDYNLHKQFKEEIKYLKEHRYTISNKKFTPTFYIVTGHKGGKKYFLKRLLASIETEDFQVIHSIQIEYTDDEDLQTLQRLNDWF